MSTIRRTRSAAHGPDFTDSRTTDLAVTTVLRGPQDTGISTGTGDAGHHVAVRIGRVLVYCYDEDAVTAHVATWRQAVIRARRSFPDGHVAELPDLTTADSLSVGSAALHVTGELAVTLTSATPPAVRTPFVRLQVGQLTTVALDTPAVQTALAAWAAAETAAEDLFHPDPANLTRQAIAHFERAARRQPRYRA